MYNALFIFQCDCLAAASKKTGKGKSIQESIDLLKISKRSLRNHKRIPASKIQNYYICEKCFRLDFQIKNPLEHCKSKVGKEITKNF